MEKNQENQINFGSAFSSMGFNSPNREGGYNQTPLTNKENKICFQNSPIGKNIFGEPFTTPQKNDITNFNNGYIFQSGETPIRFSGEASNFPFTFGFSGSKPEYVNSQMQIVPKHLFNDLSPFRQFNNFGNSNRKASFDRG